MKQHQMTHKFRDSDNFETSLSSPLTAASSSSPLNSPPTSSPTSPAFSSGGGGGVKRSQDEVGVSLVDRPPEKRAILCG